MTYAVPTFVAVQPFRYLPLRLPYGLTVLVERNSFAPSCATLRLDLSTFLSISSLYSCRLFLIWSVNWSTLIFIIDTTSLAYYSYFIPSFRCANYFIFNTFKIGRASCRERLLIYIVEV